MRKERPAFEEEIRLSSWDPQWPNGGVPKTLNLDLWPGCVGLGLNN